MARNRGLPLAAGQQPETDLAKQERVRRTAAPVLPNCNSPCAADVSADEGTLHIADPPALAG